MSLLFLLLFSCRSIHQTGEASWYGRQYAGNPTASGEKFRTWKMTAAHRSLPIGTKVKVTRVDTGKSVTVVINDRGPFIDGRIIDLSRRAARKLDMIDSGVADVELRVVGCKKSTKRSACD
jgi:rare lipoprotein A